MSFPKPCLKITKYILFKSQDVSVPSISGYIAIRFTTDAFLGDIILLCHIVAYTVQYYFCHIFKLKIFDSNIHFGNTAKYKLVII